MDVEAPGIRRERSGRGFTYRGPSGRTVRDRATLARIRALAIPPAWIDVWISPLPDGHIQAIGRDAAGRRQYRYHPAFRARRDRGKFDRLIEFGERLPRIRRRVERDLGRRGLPREKVIAAVVSLLELTSLRVGNPEYATLNRSFGLSTLRDRHARIKGSAIRFRFRGKGGRTEDRTVIDRRLAAIVRRCQDLPGQELFQFVGDDGDSHAISSEDVNSYIRAAAGAATLGAKDFRTWTATLRAYRELRAAPDGAVLRRRNEAIRLTAEMLGNTPAVTRGSYVHPAVIDSFAAEPVGKASGSAPDVSGAGAANGSAVAAGRVPEGRELELDLLRLLRSERTRARRRSRRPG